MISLAQKLASKSTHHQHHHAVIIERGGAIVSMGHNHETHHAERVALNKIWPNKRKNLRVWSFRFTKAGKLGMAKPCKKCHDYLLQNGVTTVFYSTNEGTIEKLKL